MKLNSLFESILLEKVYGAYAVVYHRTTVEDLADKVYTSGFKPGDGAMYGKGFYSTYELESQTRPEMAHTYGDIIVKFAVPITNFVFFDYEPFLKSPLAGKIKDHDKSNFIFKQLDYFKMEYNKEQIQKKLGLKFSSDLALNCYKHIRDFTKKCDGIVFTGSRDGKVLVCYNLKSIIPLSYKKDGDDSFTKITNKSLEYLKSAWKEKNRPEGERPPTLEQFEITDYTINPDGTIDVEGDVDLKNQKLQRIPFKFRKVTGNFDCSLNVLTSLEGCPKEVRGFFDCSDNNLTSIEGAPKTVGRSFFCSINKLTSLKGAPKTVGWNFDCSQNNIISLEGAPKTVGGNFGCSHNNMISLEGAPKTVGGDFYCDNNKLTSLKGSPESVVGTFICYDNKLASLEGAPKTVGGNFKCHRNAASFTEEEVRAVTKVGGEVIV